MRGGGLIPPPLVLMDPEIVRNLQADCLRLVEEHNVAINKMTQKQVAEAFKQAVLAGDFQMHVVAYGDNCQSVTYLPYERVESLEQEIIRLKQLLSSYSIPYDKILEPEEL